MLATRLDCLIRSELSEPHRAKLTLTERISYSVRGFPSQAKLRACSVRLGSLASLILYYHLAFLAAYIYLISIIFYFNAVSIYLLLIEITYFFLHLYLFLYYSFVTFTFL